VARIRLRVTSHDDGVVEAEVRRHLYAFNVAATGIDDGQMLIASARDDDGRLVAGLYGWTWGGTAFVDLLWVDAALRGQGLGSRLLTAAEDEARTRGCRLVVLATHGFQAPDFYAARGYVEHGRIDDYPLGSFQSYLAKPLRPDPSREGPEPGHVRGRRPPR
jgi:GNAT superfamily N-acetyltransferase